MQDTYNEAWDAGRISLESRIASLERKLMLLIWAVLALGGAALWLLERLAVAIGAA